MPRRCGEVDRILTDPTHSTEHNPAQSRELGLYSDVLQQDMKVNDNVVQLYPTKLDYKPNLDLLNL